MPAAHKTTGNGDNFQVLVLCYEVRKVMSEIRLHGSKVIDAIAVMKHGLFLCLRLA